MDATQPVSGAGTHPVLSWTAPALGTADHYAILVVRLADDGTGKTLRSTFGWLTTTDTAIQIPTLDPSYQYAFRIQAEHGVDLQRHYTPPMGRANYVTATITP
jgi:hypothetical protein